MINTLKTLDLSHNAITGKIPPGAWSVPDRTAAHVLVLTASALCVRVATAVFGDMPALVILDLSWNQLSGGIPANMVNFTCVAHAAAAAAPCAWAAALWPSRVTPPPGALRASMPTGSTGRPCASCTLPRWAACAA